MVFSPLLKLKKREDFKWENKHQQAFDEIKKCLANPPVVIRPSQNTPLKLYISTSDDTIGSMLC
jgi:hypothetical protein